MKGNGFGNSSCKMLDNWWKYKENGTAGRLFLAHLDKLTKENTSNVQHLSNLYDKNDGLQTPIKSRAFYVHRGRESSLLHPELKLWKIKLSKAGLIIAKMCLNQTKVCLNG